MPVTAAEILEVLNEFGIDCSVTTYPNKTFDPATNSVTLGTPQVDTVKAVPPYEVVDQWGNTNFISHGKGLSGFANENLPFTVEKGMELTMNGVVWTVEGVTPVSTGSGVVYWQVEITT